MWYLVPALYTTSAVSFHTDSLNAEVFSSRGPLCLHSSCTPAARKGYDIEVAFFVML